MVQLNITTLMFLLPQYILHTLAYARIDPPNSIFEPGHLSRRIADDTQYTIQSADILTTSVESTHSTHDFLHPRAQRRSPKQGCGTEAAGPFKG